MVLRAVLLVATVVPAALGGPHVVRPLSAGNFLHFPGYIGQLQAGGTVNFGESGGDILVSYSISGADSTCAGTGAGKACGVTIFDGSSCSNVGAPLGDPVHGGDPWTVIKYTGADPTGQNVVVAAGRRLGELEGRPAVIFDSSDKGISCAIVKKVGLNAVPALVATVSTYPGYSGPLKVEGSSLLYETNSDDDPAQVLQYDLTGVDPKCSSVVDGVPNACGIHVHSGTTCEAASEVGGHYYAGDVDTWKPVVFLASDEQSAGTTSPVVTGLRSADVRGRALVVHDSTGARVACGLISTYVPSTLERPLIADSFEPSIGYAGDLSVDGTVMIGQANDDLVLFYTLDGADENCDGTGEGDACTLVVHNGCSCLAVGGPFGDTAAGNPWVTHRYSGPNATGQNILVSAGKDLWVVRGRTIVIYDSAGEAVACSQISQPQFNQVPTLQAELGTYPGYGGPLQVGGDSLIFEAGSGSSVSQVLRFDLDGVDPLCSTIVEGVPNACGIHVHKGSTCSDAAEVGGHYFLGDVDPWKPIVYVTGQGGTSGTTIFVDTGATSADVDGRTIVVHDATGARIACGLIRPAVPSSAWRSSTVLGLFLVTLLSLGTLGQ